MHRYSKTFFDDLAFLPEPRADINLSDVSPIHDQHKINISKR